MGKEALEGRKGGSGGGREAAPHLLQELEVGLLVKGVVGHVLEEPPGEKGVTGGESVAGEGGHQGRTLMSRHWPWGPFPCQRWDSWGQSKVAGGKIGSSENSKDKEIPQTLFPERHQPSGLGDPAPGLCVGSEAEEEMAALSTVPENNQAQEVNSQAVSPGTGTPSAPSGPGFLGTFFFAYLLSLKCVHMFVCSPKQLLNEHVKIFQFVKENKNNS